MIMASLWSAFISLSFFIAFSPMYTHSHALARVRVRDRVGDLRMDPQEAIVYAGINVTFTCSYPSNITFVWDFTSKVQSYEIVHGSAVLNDTRESIFFSRLTVFSVSRLMSGEIVCSMEEGPEKAVGLLIVQGVRNGGPCRNTSDCITDRAICYEGLCECPKSYVRLRLKEGGYDVCRQMIYSLYDPCEFDEQCATFVDPKSVCNSVCVCAPYARDRKGRCISLNELSYNRSQEMYRVGLIAVTCIIILIVAMSLWVTLKKSCQEQTPTRSASHTDSNYPEAVSTDPSADKPPSYEDVLGNGENVTAPPNMKEALKNCMTAKRLLRQVSAPAGQLLPQTMSVNKNDVPSKTSNQT